MSLESLLSVAAILFCIGLYGALSRTNVIAVFMSIEIMFNAVNLTFVAFGRYVTPQAFDVNLSSLLTGQVFVIFVITVAAAEIALGVGIVLALYRTTNSIDLSKIVRLRH